jgi:predicted MFS family arabinose efflux permease
MIQSADFNLTDAGNDAVQSESWTAIFAIALGVAGLIIAEFLPAGMLTPMARDLRITEGMAGQAVTATSLFAVLSSLLIAYLTRTINRRYVLLSLSSALIASNLLVAFAPNFTVLLIGRVLLGISLGGFWSMAAATATRLVKSESVPKALAIIFGASSFASVFAAPLSSYLSNVIGWRNVFLISAALSIVAFALQTFAIPSLKPVGEVRLKTLLTVLQKPRFGIAMVAVALVFGGFFSGFTYVRPFLEKITEVGPNGLTAILLTFGIANFIGTSFGGKMVEKGLEKSLWLLPLILAAVGVGLSLFGKYVSPTAALVFVWGAIFGPVSVVWSAWVAKKVPENAETAGGIFIAAIQLSAAIGAMAGGVVFDHGGVNGVFVLSTVSSLLSVVVAVLWVNARANLALNGKAI